MRSLALAAVLALAACGGDDDSGAPPDTAPDGGQADATTDAGPDAGPTDAMTAGCEVPVPGTPADLDKLLVGEGFERPVLMVSPPADPRLFVVEQTGQIQILGGAQPFLVITDQVECCGEEGLLGLAFHPQYATNGRFYVYYTDLGSDIQVDEYTVTA